MPSRYFVPSTSTFREGFEKLLDAGLFHEIADHLDAGDVSDIEQLSLRRHTHALRRAYAICRLCD